MCVGTMCAHPEAFYYWVHLKYLQVPIVAAFVVLLLVVERTFVVFSARIIATAWAAAFSTYLTVPATKILVKAPISSSEKEMYLISAFIGFAITWYLFHRSHSFDKPTKKAKTSINNNMNNIIDFVTMKKASAKEKLQNLLRKK